MAPELRPVIGIMWVIEDHLRPSGHIMPDHVGDRGAVRQILEPRDHLHINQIRMDCAAGRALVTQVRWLCLLRVQRCVLRVDKIPGLVAGDFVGG
jgi:hypothetical protein